MQQLQHHHCQHPGFDETGACTWCGLVLYPVQTRDVEWRTYRNEEQDASIDVRQRADLYDSRRGTGTSLSHTFVCASRDVVRQHIRLRARSSESIISGYCNELENICDRLDIPRNTITGAKALLNFVSQDNGMWRSSKRHGVMAACIAIVCQRDSVGITDKEILSCSLITSKPAYVNKQKRLVLEMLHRKGVPLPLQPHAGLFSVRMCRQLGLSADISRNVREMADNMHRSHDMKSMHCTSVVAVCILTVLLHMRVQTDLTDLAGYCNVTKSTLIKWFAEAHRKSIQDVKPYVMKVALQARKQRSVSQTRKRHAVSVVPDQTAVP